MNSSIFLFRVGPISQLWMLHDNFCCRSSANLGSTFVLRDRVPVSGMVYDPMFTIVFTLEYMVTEPINKTSTQVGLAINELLT